MKVEMANESRIEFKNLKDGKCFKFKGEVYIKVKAPNPERYVNAAKLTDGSLFYFELDCKVLPVGAKVIIF